MPSLAEAVTTFLQLRRAKSTQENYRRILLPLCDGVGGKRSLKRITLADLVDYTSTYTERGIANSSYVQYVTIIRSFFNWCVSVNYLAVSPCRGLKLSKGEKPPPESYAMPNDTMRGILDLVRARAALGKPRDYAILCLLADTACRVGAIARLRMQDLDLQKRRISVIEKRDKHCFAYYTDQETEHAIRLWLIARSRLDPLPDNDYLFVSARSPYGPIAPRDISDMIARLTEQIDPSVSYRAHSIRHWVAERYDAAGYGAEAISAKLNNTPEVAARNYMPSAAHRRAQQVSDSLPLSKMLDITDDRDG